MKIVGPDATQFQFRKVDNAEKEGNRHIEDSVEAECFKGG
jgi:hypothetical protein